MGSEGIFAHNMQLFHTSYTGYSIFNYKWKKCSNVVDKTYKRWQQSYQQNNFFLYACIFLMKLHVHNYVKKHNVWTACTTDHYRHGNP